MNILILAKKRSSGGASYLLDTYTPAVAYSFQKLRTGETYGFRIRRDNDNAETDVELESTDSITLSSTVSSGGTLGTWLGANDGYIHTFYDQSGNDNDLVQTTQSLQSKIATAGVLESKDGKIAATFATDVYDATPLACMQGGEAATAFGLVSPISLNYLGVLFSTSDDNASTTRINMIVDTSTSKALTYNLTSGGTRAINLISQQNTTDRRLQTWIKDATDQYAFLDGTIQSGSGSYNPAAIGNTTFKVGAQMSNISYGSYQLQELIVMPSDETSNRIAIEADINGRY